MVHFPCSFQTSHFRVKIEMLFKVLPPAPGSGSVTKDSKGVAAAGSPSHRASDPVLPHPGICPLWRELGLEQLELSAARHHPSAMPLPEGV